MRVPHSATETRYVEHFRIDPAVLLPFNDDANLITCRFERDQQDGLSVVGSVRHHVHKWTNVGYRSRWLRPHSFAVSVSVTPVKQLGAYSLGVIGNSRLNVTHFIKSATSLGTSRLGNDFYSGFGWGDDDRRTQNGVKALQVAQHTLSVEYSHERGMLSCFAQHMPVHTIAATLEKFFLELRFEAVGVDGDFDVRFHDITYFPHDRTGKRNLTELRAFDPSIPPVFVSYAHADKRPVSRLLQLLRTRNVRVLGDWSLRPGDSLIGRLSEFISRSGWIIVVLSQSAVKSRWVNLELKTAISAELNVGSKKVLPILLEDCQVPSFLSDRLYLDMRSNRRISQSLLDALRQFESW